MMPRVMVTMMMMPSPNVPFAPSLWNWMPPLCCVCWTSLRELHRYRKASESGPLGFMSYRVRGRVNLIKPNTLYLHVHADYVGPPFAVSVVGLKVVPCIFWVCLLFRSDPCTPWWSTTFRTLRGRPTWMLGTWGGSTPSVSDGSWIPTSVARNPGTGVWKLMEWIYNHAKT